MAETLPNLLGRWQREALTEGPVRKRKPSNA